jgi:hypothetical protein
MAVNLAEARWSGSTRSDFELTGAQGITGHNYIGSLEVYANPSADSIREMTDALDSDARRPRGRPAAGGTR